MTANKSSTTIKQPSPENTKKDMKSISGETANLAEQVSIETAYTLE
jgi:hypothetical protein